MADEKDVFEKLSPEEQSTDMAEIKSELLSLNQSFRQMLSEVTQLRSAISNALD
jgi:hypothetical protein